MAGVAVDTHAIVWYLVSEVPDLPDRIVTARAVALRVAPISRDGKIRASQVQTIW